ncbi:sugar ABC transporter permease [Mycoplasma mycoides]|uniref:sugar ABC transporter permease n=1 Tax=Mycoplasma mycoides TaxID=2102 RepID=UPI00223FDAE1|nr:sugar ABC transporter permease [Mycoplasma mycoides]QVK08687.1 ABC transporter permease subunit [Mycoplasma mycoides subsp. capri]
MKTEVKQNVDQKALVFSSLLKPVEKYDFSNFKKSNNWNIIKTKLLEDETIKSTNKIKDYQLFIKSNYIVGNIVDIYKKFTTDSKLIEGLLLLLVANSFSTFNDKNNFNISNANKTMNQIIESKYVEKEIINEINVYEKQKSLKDFDHFDFKNLELYEFLNSWKKINAIIVTYFKKINLEKLGKILASEFLLTYETHKEAMDFVSLNIIQHEHLSEDYAFNKINDLLEQAFNELVNKNVENITIQETIILALKKSLTYQVDTHKKSWWEKLVENRKSKEKFRLYCSEEINERLAKELRLLTNPKVLDKSETKKEEQNEKFVHYNTLKINNKSYKIDAESLKFAKLIFKEKDLIDFQASLSETYFRSKHLNFNKYYNHLYIIKLSSLAYLYALKNKDNKINFNKAKELFELLILKTAYEISESFAKKIEKIIFNEEHLENEFFKKTKIDQLGRYKNWSKVVAINIAVYKELNLNTKIIQSATIYEILKNEIYVWESVKKSDSLLSKDLVNYNEISQYQNELIFIIEQELKKEKNNAYVKYVRFLTETFGKLYLSDKPPLSIYGKIGLAFIYLVLIAWALIIIVPITQVVLQAFNWYSANESTSTAGKLGTLGRFDFKRFAFSFANFSYLFERTFFGYWLLNSLVIATITMIFMVLITAMVGYAFSRFRFKGKRISLMTVMLIQMIPTVSSFIVFYVMFQLLQETVHITGQIMLILIYVGGGIPGNVFVLKGYLDNISTDIDDAAKIDGCSIWQVFTKIIFPLAKPMLSVIALWSFIGPFGDVLLPQLLLDNQRDWTMATGLNSLLNRSGEIAQGAFAAGSLLVAVPISTLFIMLQGNITGGLSGGVKG